MTSQKCLITYRNGWPPHCPLPRWSLSMLSPKTASSAHKYPLHNFSMVFTCSPSISKTSKTRCIFANPHSERKGHLQNEFRLTGSAPNQFYIELLRRLYGRLSNDSDRVVLTPDLSLCHTSLQQRITIWRPYLAFWARDLNDDYGYCDLSDDYGFYGSGHTGILECKNEVLSG